MGFEEAVKSDSIIAAPLGGEVNFYCNFSLSMDVLQVTWQKRNGSSFQNIATYSPNHGLRLIGSFEKKARFTIATLKASAITLQNLTFEDESHYRCIFNVFPHGSYSKDVCLNIQTISELTVEYDSHVPAEGLITAVCSATGKPAPKITWLDDRDLDGSPEIQHVQNANGTVTVANRLTFSSHLRALACLLDHPQGRKMKAVCLEKGSEGVQKSIIVVAVLIAVVFLTILIYCIMRLINRQRKKLKRCIAPRTPAKEKSLQQDLSEKAMSLHTLKDQQIVYQNEPVYEGVWGPGARSWARTTGQQACVCPSASDWGDPSERSQVPATSMAQGQSPCVPGVGAGEHMNTSKDQARQA
ncbi:PREDICTED: OX-2 membrane glycoprotein-like, partial [Pterocles gutturalis]